MLRLGVRSAARVLPPLPVLAPIRACTRPRWLCTAPPPRPDRGSAGLTISFIAFTAAAGYTFYVMTLDPNDSRPFWQRTHKKPASEEDSKKARAAEAERRVTTSRQGEARAIEALPCYLDVAVNGTPAGRIVISLFWDAVPLTCENFRALCASDAQRHLTFKGSKFHRIIPEFMIQGGDVTRGDGTGGMSIYGRTFPDENFTHKHTAAGLLSMANCGRDTNSSQFFITLTPCPHLDGKHVVFGRVIKGMDVVWSLESQGSRNGQPKGAVTIVGCGQLSAEETKALEATKA